MLSQVSTNILLDRLQQRAQYWEKLIFASGGKLKFTKCYWYIIQWSWDENGLPRQLTPSEIPASLYLTNGNDDNPQEMKRKAPTETIKTLGVHTSPSGLFTKQYKMIEEFLQNLVIKISSTHMTEMEASIIIPVYIHSEIGYIFAATRF